MLGAVSAEEGGVKTRQIPGFVAVGRRRQTVEQVAPMFQCWIERASMGPVEALVVHSLEVGLE